MSWNPNNRANTSLWLFEIWHKKQRDAGFDEVGDWKTDYIIQFSAGGDENMRSTQAKAHTELLDGAFISLYRASYEPGTDQGKALAAMLAVLNDRNKTMSDLADAVDSTYRFIGEVA